jgi:hypothetical protein
MARGPSLQASKATHHFRAAEERGAGTLATGVGVVAVREVTLAAITAMTAADGGRDDDAITWLEVAHQRADRFQHADAFAPESCLAFMPLTEPRTKCMSVPQIGEVVIRTMASVGLLQLGFWHITSVRISPMA